MNVSEEILEKLNERMGDGQWVCGLCGGTRHRVEGAVSLPKQTRPGPGITIGGPIFPLAVISCIVCGKTTFINALILLGRKRYEELIETQMTVSEVETQIKDSMKEE